jgi:hypothetical protein
MQCAIRSVTQVTTAQTAGRSAGSGGTSPAELIEKTWKDHVLRAALQST